MRKTLLIISCLLPLTGCTKTESGLAGCGVGTVVGTGIGYAIDGGAGGAIAGGLMGAIAGGAIGSATHKDDEIHEPLSSKNKNLNKNVLK